MFEYRTDGHGEVLKNQGEIKTANAYGADEETDTEGSGDGGEGEPEKISMTKNELSEKIVGGRDEGIEKGTRDTINAVNEALGTGFESVEQMNEELSEAHVGDVEESDLVQAKDARISELEGTVASLNGKIQDMRVEGQVLSNLKEQLDSKELTISPNDLKVLYSQKHDYVEKNGELYATKDGDRFLNDNGNYTTYSEGLLNFAKQKGLVTSNAKGGTGGGSEPTSNGSSENPFVTGNMTKQAQLFNEDRQRYNRLKEAAGK